MNRTKITAILPLLLLLTGETFGQEAEMADGLRAEGKIYVLVAIILVILAGLFYFVLRLDSKVSRLEKASEKKD